MRHVRVFVMLACKIVPERTVNYHTGGEKRFIIYIFLIYFGLRRINVQILNASLAIISPHPPQMTPIFAESII